jgi:5-methyltetrahydrofolate--homocysteine methyltransferase
MIQKGQAPRAKEITAELLREGKSAGDILNQGLLDGMGKIGVKFKNNEVYIPEVLIAARAMNQSMEVLRPELVKAGVKPIGKIIIATVKGDLHDIGKNLVKMMAEGTGIEVVDIGTDASPEKFVQTYKAHPDAKVVAMSALLTTTMINMKPVIDAFTEAGLRKGVKFMVGGAPLTEQFAQEIGADGYAPDAASAADRFKSFVQA